jgi:hypothetical protein
MRHPQSFTKNKQVARDLQCETIQKFLKSKLGNLSYFGLPSSSLDDVAQWSALISRITAVEKGEAGNEWELQHDLEFRAFRLGLSDKLELLRGDIDEILTTGTDKDGKKPAFPYDVVSLDYSGGLFYRDAEGKPVRLDAFDALFRAQAASKQDFVFLISCNLHAIDQGEVRKTLRNIETELVRYGDNAGKVIEEYVNHSEDEPRLRLYVPYLINQLAAKHHYQCQTEPVVVYVGNLKTRMMAFRFFLDFDSETVAIRSPRERLSQLINTPAISIVDGAQRRTMFGLPKLEAVENSAALQKP